MQFGNTANIELPFMINFSLNLYKKQI